MGATLEFYKDKSVQVAGLKPGEVVGSTLLNLSLVKPNGTVFPTLDKSAIHLVPISFQSPQPSVPALVIDTPQSVGDGFYLVSCLRTDTALHQWQTGAYVFGLRIRIADASNLFFAQTTLRMVVS